MSCHQAKSVSPWLQHNNWYHVQFYLVPPTSARRARRPSNTKSFLTSEEPFRMMSITPACGFSIINLRLRCHMPTPNNLALQLWVQTCLWIPFAVTEKWNNPDPWLWIMRRQTVLNAAFKTTILVLKPWLQDQSNIRLPTIWNKEYAGWAGIWYHEQELITYTTCARVQQPTRRVQELHLRDNKHALPGNILIPTIPYD